MKYFIGLAVVIACIVSGLAGLTIGINLNSESTTKYVLNWGSLGDWVAGAGTFIAVVVSLLLARREDSEKVIAEVGVRALLDQGAESIGLFLRATSVGRSPTTIVQVGVCVDEVPESFCPLAAFTKEVEAVPKYIARGQIFEAAVDAVGLVKIAKRLYEKVGGNPDRLHFEIRTGVETYRVKPNAAAFDLMAIAFKAQSPYSTSPSSPS